MMPFKAARLGLGVQQPQVDIFDLIAFSSTLSPAHAAASYNLAASGIGSASNNSNWTWLLLGLNTDYQVRATLTSGPTPSGDAVSSWLSLGTNRFWSYTRSIVGETIVSLTVEIRRIADNVVIANANITLDANVDS